MPLHIAQVEQLADFDTIIDVRSPSEFTQDHIHGAINCPVLNDAQRVEVGTLHNHNIFEARRLGAAYISQNMGELLQTTFSGYGKSWRPLIYCWRGGMRSGSAAHIMSQIGWNTHQLKGGYKSYRRMVLAELEKFPSKLNFIVVCGATGTGKSRFLNVLAAQGHQVLDLEALAKHRGSLLGLLPGDVQPTQRYFETNLFHELQQFNPEKPIYVEAESKRIGYVTLPTSLFDQMHQSDCIELLVPLDERIRFLCEDYHFYIESPQLLIEKIERLAPYRPKTEIQNWLDFIRQGEFPELIRELLEKHYDPLYERSTHKHYAQLASAQKLELQQLDKQVLAEEVNKFFSSC
ncbi:MAG: tRNA 2-selenouridine(34) synthase MnmH [Saezia sp.]